ncbi:MAG: hypothetical protein NC094_01305 [Bacteroidales bacterium]|nr:hypothetical protein [Lachnoclostridium sp.]MCM1384487.1 hypothetical protein [Lachnoclostridium sp.]MCM1464031.1 hypothetical protein [Bacteroidales bacterium]
MGALFQSVKSGIGTLIESIDWGDILIKLTAAIVELASQIPEIFVMELSGGLNLIGSLFNALGLDAIGGFFKGIGDALANVGAWLRENLVDPVVNWVKDLFGIHSPSKVFSEIGVFLMQGLFSGISSLTEKVVGVFTNIKDKIIGIWNTLKTTTTNIWNGIKNAIKVPINGIISFINSMLNGIGNGLNGMIDAVNQLHFDLPDWLPLVGGKSLGFTIPNITMPNIPPALANGAVFRGGNPFYAIVNDQPRGQTNIEAPLKVIKQALREELQDFVINMPKMALNYQLAPTPNFETMYGNYNRVPEIQKSNHEGFATSGLLDEETAYRIVYGATSSAIANSKLLNDQKDTVDKILKKPTMEVSELGDKLVKDSMIKGGNIRGGNMSRLAVAEEVYT